MNMNTKKIYLSTVAALLLLASCAVDVQPEQALVPGPVDEDLVPVEFSVSEMVNFTRAGSSIVSFNSGEAVKVCVSTDGGTNYTGYDFTTAAAGQSVGLNAPATPPYFPVGEGTTVKAYAYYPSTAGEAATFSVAADQTSDASYKASDLMYAAARTITKGSTEGTTLAMAHLMAQLHLNITGSGLTVRRVLVNAQRTVSFTPATGAGTATGDASDIVAAVADNENTAAGHSYVCIPQQPINSVTVKVEAGDPGVASTTATFTFTSTDNFVAGNSYPINLTVNATQLGATSAIADWNGQQAVTIAPSGDLDVEPIDAVTYNGSAQTPSLTVKKGSTTLTAGTDYDVEWHNNTNAGTAIAVILGKGATYLGSVAVAKFTINPKTLTDAMVSSISAQTYTRSQITPSVTVTDGSALTLNTDYTVSYGDNINVASGGSATVTGKGNYTGEVVKSFTINPKNISSMTLTLDQDGTAYTGNPITASVSSLKDGSYTLLSGTEYTVDGTSVTSATNAAANASATVTQNTITVNGTGNYTGSKSGTWHINRATPTLTISSYSPNPMSLTSTSATGTINVSRSGDGAVTATSSATGVATVSVTGTTVTVTAIADGSATITVKMNQGTNHTAYTATDKTVSVSASGFIIAPALGDKYYSDGTWGNNPHANGATVIGIVAWLGSDSDLKCGKSHGLVMAKSDVSSTQTWGPTSTDESFLTNTSTIDGCRSNNKNGLTNTDNLIGDSHTHNAASQARAYTPAAPSTSGNTNWFLPSAAQWLAVLGPDGIGKQTTAEQVWGSWYDSDQTAYNNITNALTASGVGGTALQYSYYWSSSEYNANLAVYVYFYSSNGVNVASRDKDNNRYVRAFLAF